MRYNSSQDTQIGSRKSPNVKRCVCSCFVNSTGSVKARKRSGNVTSLPCEGGTGVGECTLQNLVRSHSHSESVHFRHLAECFDCREADDVASVVHVRDESPTLTTALHAVHSHGYIMLESETPAYGQMWRRRQSWRVIVLWIINDYSRNVSASASASAACSGHSMQLYELLYN